MGEVVAVLLAGGTGTRAARGGPKQLAVVGGQTVLERAVRGFTGHPRVDRVVVAMSPDHLDEAGRVLAGVPEVTVIAGGPSRQASAALALAEIEDGDGTLVLIHDVARPFVPAAVIDRNLDALADHEAVSTVLPAVDTVYVTSPDGTLDEVLDRDRLRRAQTPQSFRLATIREAHRLAAADPEPATDDCTVVRRHLPHVTIALVDGDEVNVKLTTPRDFEIAEETF